MKITHRLRAAWRAFKKPALVGDGLWLQSMVQMLGHRNECALLYGELIGAAVTRYPTLWAEVVQP
jgi:hypothetical protein